MRRVASRVIYAEGRRFPMKRVHIGLEVKDLESSIKFYTNLFGAQPTHRETDYAKWMLKDPRER